MPMLQIDKNLCYLTTQPIHWLELRIYHRPHTPPEGGNKSETSTVNFPPNQLNGCRAAAETADRKTEQGFKASLAPSGSEEAESLWVSSSLSLGRFFLGLPLFSLLPSGYGRTGTHCSRCYELKRNPVTSHTHLPLSCCDMTTCLLTLTRK